MSELTLILDRKQMVVRKDGQSLRVDRPNCRSERVPLRMLAQVVMIGSPMVGCDVWRALSENNIPAVLYPARGAGRAITMGAGLSATVEIRAGQYKALFDKACRLNIGRWLVKSKLEGQKSVLKKLIGENNDQAESCLQTMTDYMDGLPDANSCASLMGREGAAASLYFKNWVRFVVHL